MQTVIFKFLSLILFISFSSVTHSYAQSIDKELVKADSLYESKQYTESIKIYENILKAGQSSPAMLLKMARIEEGLGNIPLTFYYLEKYFKITGDKKILTYLGKLSAQKNTVGFSYDSYFFMNYYYQEWKNQVNLILSVLVFWAVVAIYRNRNNKALKRKLFILLLIPLGLLAFTNNYQGLNYAIITQQPTYFLNGPSAGSGLVERIEYPAKIIIQREIDVWSKTEWQGKEAYVKSNHIKKL